MPETATEPRVSRCVFFGTKDQVGHYFFEPAGWRGSLTPVGPWGHVDGKLTPRSTTRQGAALLHHLDGWTALAFHDYTIDSRPGSNGVFLYDADLTFEKALQVAFLLFPDVVKRIGEIELVES